MEIICYTCLSKFRLANEKIPAGRVTRLPCPKCKVQITINPADRSKGNMIADTTTYDSSDKPFDFIEEDGLTALICEQSNRAIKTIQNALHLMEYQITLAENSRDALKRMRYHVYDLIVVNENFDSKSPDSNGVLIYLERLSMSIRRTIFVAMISKRYRTMDNMMSFNTSVNLIINSKNINDIGKILSRGITDNEMFYRVFLEALKESGRV